MRRMWIASVLMFGIGIGCVAATVAQNFVVPPVRAGTNPTKWEYICHHVKESSASKQAPVAEAKSNLLGAEGWELVANASATYCFKRPLP